MQKSIPSILLALAFAPARILAADAAEIAELRRQVEALTRTVTQLQQQVNRQRLAPMFGGGQPPDPRKNIVPPETHTNHDHDAHAHGGTKPGISLVLDLVGSYLRRSDNVNFIARDVQFTLDAPLGDIARGYVVVNAGTELVPTEKTNPFEEISLELEEAAVVADLRPGLQIRAGQFFADVTHLGKAHAHDLPFTDRPRSVELLVGGETKARGLELHWALPIEQPVRLTAGIVDNVGAEPPVTRRLTFLEEEGEEFGSAFAGAERRTFDHLTFYGRAETTIEPTWQTKLHLGANYLNGREEGVRTLASADARFVWTSSSGRDDRFELGGEYLWGRTEGRLADDLLVEDEENGALLPLFSTANARGGYAYAQYRFGKSFEPGVRFDFVHPEALVEVDKDGDGERDGVSRTRDDIFTYSAYVNWHLSEANRLRLQLNYIKGEREATPGSDDDWQAFLQWTMLLGPHRHAPVP